jgi:hydrogenase nickel incorporation protein HypB
VAAITKIDLAEACEFDRDLARANIESVRPGMRILETSAKTGAGIDEWLAFLAKRRAGLSAVDSEHGCEH